MPHKTDWREMIPALDDVYMFQGALFCEDCGRDIQDNIRKEGKAPEDEDDEESFDSDDFPKGPFSGGGGEADSIHHCDSNETCLNAIELPCKSKIGAWLGNDLTSEGDEWLASSIRESIFRDDAHGRQVNRLWRLKYSDPLSSLNEVEPVTGHELASPLVQQFLRCNRGTAAPDRQPGVERPGLPLRIQHAKRGGQLEAACRTDRLEIGHHARRKPRQGHEGRAASLRGPGARTPGHPDGTDRGLGLGLRCATSIPAPTLGSGSRS